KESIFSLSIFIHFIISLGLSRKRQCFNLDLAISSGVKQKFTRRLSVCLWFLVKCIKAYFLWTFLSPSSQKKKSCRAYRIWYLDGSSIIKSSQLTVLGFIFSSKAKLWASCSPSIRLR